MLIIKKKRRYYQKQYEEEPSKCSHYVKNTVIIFNLLKGIFLLCLGLIMLPISLFVFYFLYLLIKN